MLQRLRRRPSPALAISLVALFVALGGTTYAATGGTFVLGQANTANTQSSLTAQVAGGKALQLTNTTTTAGSTALGLNVASGKPPLATNSSTQVANLNASKLGGKSLAQVLATTRATVLLDRNFQGNQLPMTASFTSRGGTLLVFATGSGYSPTANAPVSAFLLLDETPGGADQLGSLITYTNEANSHHTFAPFIHATSPGYPAAGNHTVTVRMSNGLADVNDYFGLLIVELPS